MVLCCGFIAWGDVSAGWLAGLGLEAGSVWALFTCCRWLFGVSCSVVAWGSLVFFGTAVACLLGLLDLLGAFVLLCGWVWVTSALFAVCCALVSSCLRCAVIFCSSVRSLSSPVILSLRRSLSCFSLDVTSLVCFASPSDSVFHAAARSVRLSLISDSCLIFCSSWHVCNWWSAFWAVVVFVFSVSAVLMIVALGTLIGYTVARKPSILSGFLVSMLMIP